MILRTLLSKFDALAMASFLGSNTFKRIVSAVGTIIECRKKKQIFGRQMHMIHWHTSQGLLNIYA